MTCSIITTTSNNGLNMTTMTTITTASPLRDTLAPNPGRRRLFLDARQAAHTAAEKIPQPEIRLYNPATDRVGVEAVFVATYRDLYPFKGLLKIAFIVFCRAYLDISPETCFVLSLPPSSPDKVPAVLGYVVSTLSSHAFCESFSADRENCRSDIEVTPAAPKIDEMRKPELRARCMEYFNQRNRWVSAVCSGVAGIEGIVLSRAKAMLEAQYPAHFHVVVLPEMRRQGYGSRMVETLLAMLSRLDVKGVFAATPLENECAQGLFRKCGFDMLKDVGNEAETESEFFGGTKGGMKGRVFAVKKLR